MKKLVYQCVILRFVPFPMTEEFANVGVVICCPEINWFGYKLDSSKRSKRVCDFFDIRRNKDLYKLTLHEVSGELELVKSHIHAGTYRATAALERIARPRQTIVQASKVRTGLVSLNPEEIVEELFSKYVVVPEAAKDYRELELERNLKNRLDELKLDVPFKKDVIGTQDTYKVTFPLVRDVQGRKEIIKPLYLGQNEPSKILEHGDHLIARFKRLKKFQLLPEKILIAYDGCKDFVGDNFINNQNIILRDLEDFATLVPVENFDLISEFISH